MLTKVPDPHSEMPIIPSRHRPSTELIDADDPALDLNRRSRDTGDAPRKGPMVLIVAGVIGVIPVIGWIIGAAICLISFGALLDPALGLLEDQRVALVRLRPVDLRGELLALADEFLQQQPVPADEVIRFSHADVSLLVERGGRPPVMPDDLLPDESLDAVSDVVQVPLSFCSESRLRTHYTYPY